MLSIIFNHVHLCLSFLFVVVVWSSVDFSPKTCIFHLLTKVYWFLNGIKSEILLPGRKFKDLWRNEIKWRCLRHPRSIESDKKSKTLIKIPHQLSQKDWRHPSWVFLWSVCYLSREKCVNVATWISIDINSSEKSVVITWSPQIKAIFRN